MSEQTEETTGPVIDAPNASLNLGRSMYELVSGSAQLREPRAEPFNAGGSRADGREHEMTHKVGGDFAVAILALVSCGDVAVSLEPPHSSHAEQAAVAAATLAGRRMDDVNRRQEVGQRVAAITGVSCLVMRNPSNPAGYVRSEHELAELVALTGEHDASVISNEAYHDVAFDGNTFASSAPQIAGTRG